MKTLNLIIFFFVLLSSCGQTGATNHLQTSNKPSSDDTLKVFRDMTKEICNCTSVTMRNNKPSTTLDSCYMAVLFKYTDSLKRLGYSPASSIGKHKLLNEIRIYQCRELYSLMQKEWADEEANKLYFKGEFVSQKELGSGEYEIVIRSNTTKEQKVFKRKNPFDENSIKNYMAGYELTVEYEVVRNPKTKKDELYLKENGIITSVGAVPVTDQK